MVIQKDPETLLRPSDYGRHRPCTVWCRAPQVQSLPWWRSGM